MAEAILNGKNIILQAPTGAGKSLASIMPFIIANEEKISFPRKLVYSTPRRTLVNSLYLDLKDEINKGDFNKDYKITIQTGENKEDKYFNGDIIFTTFDQSLSSFLSIPISLSNRLGNINVGALLSSYLVFDEFHLFDLDGSYTTTVLLLEKLKGKVPFCIMTATLSDEKTEYLSKKLNAKIIKADSSKYLADIVTQKGKERRVFVKPDSKIKGEDVVSKHSNIESDHKDKSKKTIVMCNRVENAQEIYKEIKCNIDKGTEVILIHSRFLEEDRKYKEVRIKKLFSKNNKNSNVILVSTQVIEVGIDITSHIMHTEISSIDSFLQRIGRCARYANEKGNIYIYQPYNEGEKRYLPYNEMVVLKTMEALQEIDSQILDTQTSQKIIDRVYSIETDVDKKENEKVETNTGDFLLEIWKDPNKKRFKELVRDVVGCNIVIKKWICDGMSPYNYQSLGISPWTLKSKVNEISKLTDEWIIKEVIEFDKEDKTKYTYKEISSNSIYPNNLYIINPAYFAYDKEMGLLFNKNNDDEFKPLTPEKREDYEQNYVEESYFQHINAIKAEVKELKEELNYGLEIIKEEFNLSDNDIDNIIEFTIWAHDLGKLQKDWQSAHQIKEYEFIAHANRIKQPPGHAAESLWIINNLLYSFVNECIGKNSYIFQVIGKTIASHHSLSVKEALAYSIDKNSIDYLLSNNKEFFSFSDTLGFINNNLKELMLTLKAREGIADDIRLRDIIYYKFYFILIRILRIADQKATQKLNEKGVR